MKYHKKKINIGFIDKIIQKFLHNHNSPIHTRFPPEPNGYLHIGHAKSIFLNFEIAKNYNGKCNLRFDDTNPIKENIKYIHSIKRDIQWLGYQWYKETKYASQYFQKMYEYAIELIKKKLAYVDQLNQLEIRKYRGTLEKGGINSPYRNQTIEKNLILFQDMKEGKIKEGQACLRAKINMNSACIIMRDPVLYRIKFKKHHQTKNKWCIYPTYDFAHCISDAIEGITHSLCTLEFQDNKKLYNWILDNINIKHHPTQHEYSRLNLEYSVLSKRKLQILIDNNIVKDWNDPRMPTLSGLRKRGYTPTAIKNFCNKIGITKQNNLIEMQILESCIRKELNQIAYRTMAILNPIKVIIYNLPKNYEQKINILNHPKNLQFGKRKIHFTNEIYIEKSDFQEKGNNKYKRLVLGGTVKLKYSCFITAQYIQKDKNQNIKKIFCTYQIINKINYKKYGIIHWISKKNTMQAEFRLYNHIFNIKNPDIKKNILSYINQQSKIIKYGLIHKSITKNLMIKFYQFERIGYFCIDKNFCSNKKIIFHRTVTLKENWNT
ncbi:glutamine--tRNA ligase [Buchnera aphidicola]|uniref:glutamine--tRNA ligase n=1 Tax=Buchnera aphidicola TaxID=9 RepID=UPI003463D92F